MKTKSIVITAAALLLPLAGFAQTPPAPQPPPPGPPPSDSHREKEPKVPVTFLGVETSPVPRVVSEQLGLAKGFGLVVDYVVPDGPAAAAGVKENDILKMLNDQILTEPDQLSKLVRSFSEDTNVTLTILRKSSESKVTVKLGKRDVPSHGPGMRRFEKHWNVGDGDFGNLGDKMQMLQEQLGNDQRGMIRGAVEQARHEVERAKGEIMRAQNEARRAMQDVRVSTTDDNGTIKTTRIDLGKAQIVFSDGSGEMKIESVNGKKQLTAKDSQGRLLFSGPVETNEDRDKMPAEVRQRFEKLEDKDLPAAIPPMPMTPVPNVDDDSDSDAGEVDQVSLDRPFWPLGTIRV